MILDAMDASCAAPMVAPDDFEVGAALRADGLGIGRFADLSIPASGLM